MPTALVRAASCLGVDGAQRSMAQARLAAMAETSQVMPDGLTGELSDERRSLIQLQRDNVERLQRTIGSRGFTTITSAMRFGSRQNHRR